MTTSTVKRGVITLFTMIASIYLQAQTPTVTIDPPSAATTTIVVGHTVNFTATRNGNGANWPGGNSNFTYTWNSTGPASINFNPLSSSCNCNSGSTVATFNTIGTFTITCTAQEGGGGLSATSAAKTVIVVGAPPGPNLWASTNSGNAISSFAVAAGALSTGPTTLFDPFPATTETTAALGRNDIPNPTNGFFYFCPNTSGNNGVITVYGANATGGDITNIGALDLNGASNNSLGFVRLGMGPDGTGWILAGDGTTLYLAKFMSNGVSPVTISLEDADGVTLSGGAVATFQNGDICVTGTNTLFALANNGSGVTQIFIGAPNGNNTTLTKKWDLVDETNTAFTGSVNGVAFDAIGSLYISTASGLYFINQSTVNGPAGTVQCSLVWTGTGLTDLASNVFPAQTTLPVRLVYFRGDLRNGNVNLSWESSSENDLDNYIVQRSFDGSSFTDAGTVAPAGEHRPYTFVDVVQGNPSKIYYRLMIVERARTSYSSVLLIKPGQKNNLITVSPNPFRDRVQFNITSDKESNLRYALISVDGRQINSGSNKIAKGSNTFFINDLELLQPGMYLLRIQVNEELSTMKLVKK